MPPVPPAPPMPPAPPPVPSAAPEILPRVRDAAAGNTPPPPVPSTPPLAGAGPPTPRKQRDIDVLLMTGGPAEQTCDEYGSIAPAEVVDMVGAVMLRHRTGRACNGQTHSTPNRNFHESSLGSYSPSRSESCGRASTWKGSKHTLGCDSKLASLEVRHLRFQSHEFPIETNLQVVRVLARDAVHSAPLVLPRGVRLLRLGVLGALPLWLSQGTASIKPEKPKGSWTDRHKEQEGARRSA